MKQCVMGIDGGGTHTRLELLEVSGRLLSRAETGPTDVDGVDWETARARLCGAIDEALNRAGEPVQVKALYAGISGCASGRFGARYRQALQDAFEQIERIEVGSDLINPLYSVTSGGEAIVAVCGTGAAACAWQGGGRYRVDGHGYLLGDEGGGFSIGRSVLASCLRDEDGRGPATAMTGICRGELGMTVTEAADALTRAGKAKIASFAQVAFRCALLGDAMACGIIARAADHLAEDVLVLARRFDSARIPVILCGGLWDLAEGMLRREVQARLGERVCLIAPRLSPVRGAAVRAMSLIDSQAADAFREALREQ